MMIYSLGQDLTFVILAIISSLAMLSQHIYTSAAFFVISILFVIFEHQIYYYLKSA